MKIDILGVKVSKLTTRQVLDQIRDFLYSNKKHYIVTPNPEFVMEAQRDKEFKEILNNADIAIPDGIGLIWATKYLSFNITNQSFILRHLQAFWQIVYTGVSLVFYPKYCKTVLPERITGSDLIWAISKICAEEGKSIYLLGAGQGIAGLAAKKLKSRIPNLEIAGTFSGSPAPDVDSRICAIINSKNPDFLFVAYGHPKQEKWISRNLQNLKTVKIAMGVGGAYDFIVGKVKRAPKFFQKLGIEWLWRFFHQPWRAKRIFTATWRFAREVYKYKIKNSNFLEI